MATSTLSPSDTTDAIDECTIDGADLFAEDRFSARVKTAAEAGRPAVISLPDIPTGRLTGTTYALLQVFVETRLRTALHQVGYHRVERRCEEDGRAYLVATR